PPPSSPRFPYTTLFRSLITGLGLGALYFLVASGLSLIYGLMGVLNFAHGSFLTLGAFAGWEVARRMDGGSWVTFLVSIVVGALVDRKSTRLNSSHVKIS